MNEKILTVLGFASKAKKLSFGMDATVGAIKRGSSRLSLVVSDISAKSQKEIAFFTNKHNVPFAVLDIDMQTLTKAVGKKCGIISVNDNGFAESIAKLSAQEEKE